LPQKHAPKFQKGNLVVYNNELDILGTILQEPEYDSQEWWYEVQFGAQRQNLPESSLSMRPSIGMDVHDLALNGQWGHFDAFLRVVAIERILHQKSNTIYSFNASRIQFMPHQYIPLLKLLDSEDRRLIIADEVGLGKTIEAGLILTEMRSRQKMDRVLILVPSRLRSKWQAEMQRKFRMDFDIWGGSQIREFAQRMERGGSRSGFFAIASMQMLRSRRMLDAFLEAVDSMDFLVIDEAHHARNPATATSAMIQELSSITEGLLMLSATPLHLGSSDLFNLLHLIRPKEFQDPGAFEKSLMRNEGVVRAQSAARRRHHADLSTAAQLIRKLHRLPAGATASDPLLADVLRTIEAIPDQSEKWHDLERELDRAHVISHVFTRTKKRDVYEDAAERSGHWVHVDWTEEEDRAYCELAGIDPAAGVSRIKLQLGQMQRARQAASSVHGTLLYRRSSADMADDLSDLELESDSDIAVSDFQSSGRLPKTDSKYERLVEVLKSLWAEDPTRKVIIFTFFIGTSRYLADRLAKEFSGEGRGVLRIAGDVPSNPRDPKNDLRAIIIEQFKNQEDSRVLISTEVGSEGLDFQFCSVVVNYDLPWNPMVVEQRIGRIDRFGQKSPKVHIYSFVVRNTIEDRILEKLYSRIGIFERSIGDLETIIGGEMSELRSDYFSGELTAKELEQKAERTARVIEKKTRDAIRLEKKAESLFGHEDYIREEVNRVQRLGRYLAPTQIRSVLQGYLERQHPDIRIQEPTEGVWRIRLTDRLLQDIEAASKAEDRWAYELRMRSHDGHLLMTTDGERAYKDPSLDLLSAVHPLVRTAAHQVEPLLSEAGAHVGCLRLRSGVDPELNLQAGVHFLAIFGMEVKGFRSRRALEPILITAGQAVVQSGDAAERFAFLCLDHGEVHPEPSRLPSLPQGSWDALKSRARQISNMKRIQEQKENEALLERRRQRIEDEMKRRIKSVDERLETLRSRSRGERVIELTRAQRDAIEARFRQQLDNLDSARQVEVGLHMPPVALCAVEVY